MRCAIGVDQIPPELFKSGQYLHSTKNRPTSAPSSLVLENWVGWCDSLNSKYVKTLNNEKALS